MIARAGAGPLPIPYKELTAEKLAGAIKQALQPDMLQQAGVMAERMRQETGVETGAESFESRVQKVDFRCDFFPDRHASLQLRNSKLKISGFAAAILIHSGKLRRKDLRM